jgi:SAM-dependent methyltransferase
MLKKYFIKLIENAIKQNETNILKLSESNSKCKMLDLGCDDGTWTEKIASKIRTKNISGVEVVKERGRLAEKRGIVTYPYDLNQVLKFSDKSFDFVHANQVIEHLYDTDTFVSEIYRILKPNGYTIVSTENLASLHNIFALSLGFQPFSMSNYSSKGNIGNPFALWNNTKGHFSDIKAWQHNRLFSYFGLKDLFVKHGFKVEAICTAGFYPFPGVLSRLDPIHGHWITIKARKV